MATLAVIIPAAGLGTRMKSEVPKPFLQIKGRTILEWTVDGFVRLPGVRQVIIATNTESIKMAREIFSDHSVFDSEILQIVEGGSDRQESVGKGLEAVNDAELVAVHDAVRPLVRKQHIEQCCETAEKYDGAVLGVPARDTIKECDKNGFIRSTPDRSRLWQCQTPQVFRTDILRSAFENARKTHYKGTDDASLVEHMGGTVRMVQGDAYNIKITYPEDILFAEILIEREYKR